MISIIIPTYNSAKFIVHALQSIFSQTYQDFEIIVIDDGSTDATKAVLEPYLDRLYYVYQENAGESSARNHGLSLAKGEYIAFLDADDLYKPNKLERQLSVFLKDSSIDVVYNDVEVVDENLQFISILKSEEVYETEQDFLCMLLVRQIVPGPASIMLKRECIDSGIRYPEQYKNAEDYQFIIELAMHHRFKYLEEALYVYRRHSKNLTNNHEKQLKTEIEIIKKLGLEKLQHIVNLSNFAVLDKEFILAQIFMKIENWQDAINILSNFTENYMNHYTCFYLGNCYYKEHNFEKAISTYEAVICIEPNMAESYNNLGCMYALLNKFSKAKEKFEQALLIRKEYIDAKHNIEQLSNNNNNNKKYKITMRHLRRTLTVY